MTIRKKIYRKHKLYVVYFNGYTVKRCQSCNLWRPIKNKIHPIGFNGIITNYKKCVVREVEE